MGFFLTDAVKGVGKAIGGAAKGAFNVAKKVAPIASMVPGPWQVPAIAFTAGNKVLGGGGGAPAPGGGGINIPGVGNIDLGKVLGGAGAVASGVASAAQMGEAKGALDTASQQWQERNAMRAPYRQAATSLMADERAWNAPDISSAFGDPTNPFAAGRTFNASKLLNRGVPQGLQALNSATQGFSPKSGKPLAPPAVREKVPQVAMDVLKLVKNAKAKKAERQATVERMKGRPGFKTAMRVQSLLPAKKKAAPAMAAGHKLYGSMLR
jgi:hypothetical protein